MKRFETGLFRRTQEILSQGESKQITFLIPLGDRRMPAPAALSSGNLGTPSLFVSGLLCVHMSVPSVKLSPVRHSSVSARTSYPSCLQKLNPSNVRERTLNVVMVKNASCLLHSFVGPSPG